VEGWQDPDRGEQVTQVGVGPIDRHGLERGVGDLDIAAGHRGEGAGAGGVVEPVQSGLGARAADQHVEDRLQPRVDPCPRLGQQGSEPFGQDAGCAPSAPVAVLTAALIAGVDRRVTCASGAGGPALWVVERQHLGNPAAWAGLGVAGEPQLAYLADRLLQNSP
jgi:hypothetical protein